MNESILFAAFRYALGRKTYIVSEVFEKISKNWDNLSQQFKDNIKNEIRDCKDLGHDCDREMWETILDYE